MNFKSRIRVNILCLLSFPQIILKHTLTRSQDIVREKTTKVSAWSKPMTLFISILITQIAGSSGGIILTDSTSRELEIKVGRWLVACGADTGCTLARSKRWLKWMLHLLWFSSVVKILRNHNATPRLQVVASSNQNSCITLGQGFDFVSKTSATSHSPALDSTKAVLITLWLIVLCCTLWDKYCPLLSKNITTFFTR